MRDSRCSTLGYIDWHRLVSGGLADHVFAAEGVRDTQRALRIVSPFAVHEEAVGVAARGQFYRGGPDAGLVLVEWDAVFLPVGEVADQDHAPSIGSGEAEGLLV